MADNTSRPRPTILGLMNDGREGSFETEQILGQLADTPARLLDPTLGALETGFRDTKDALSDLFVDFLAPSKENRLQIGGKSEINFNNQRNYKEKWEAEYKRSWTKRLDQDLKNVRQTTQQQAIEDLVRLEIGAMPTDEKNKSLHLSLDLDEKYINNPYHIYALKIKKIEEIKAALQKKEEQDVASAARNPNLLLNMNAQEGQSAVSSSGAIFSAG